MTSSDIAEVTAIVRSSGTSFYHGMKILPAPRRDAIYAIYAFCRVVDDIADDEGKNFTERRQQLQAWRRRVKSIFLGQTFDPLSRTLRGAVQTYDLREADFQAIIDGMDMDAGAPIIAPSLAELDLYCDRVAAAVGRISVRIFGDPTPAAQDVAHALGRALQLTNILRDVAEDAARGRIYLPAEFLAAAGIAADPATLLHHPNLAGVCARVADMAADKFQAAAVAMALCDPRAMRPARLMAASYQPLLGLLHAQKFDYSGPRVRLRKWQKLRLAAQVFLP